MVVKTRTYQQFRKKGSICVSRREAIEQFVRSAAAVAANDMR